MSESLAAHLEAHRPELRRFLEREASSCLRFEAVDDLVQGVLVRALAEDRQFSWRGVAAFRSWLFTIARRHVADRRDHWMSMKRGAGRVLRITRSGTTTRAPGSASAPRAGGPGPGTLASGREQLRLVTQALAALPPRDRQLVRWMSEAVPVDEQAATLGINREAAQRASQRAIERLQKTFRLILQRRAEPPGLA